MFRSSLICAPRPRILHLKKLVKPPRVPTYSKYQCFVQEANKRPEIRNIKPFEQKSMTIAHLWRNMTEAQKKPFEELSKKSKATSRTQKKQGLQKKGGWKDFVRKHYKTVKHYPVTDRLAVLSKKWKALQKNR